MSKTKKILAIVLALTMALCLGVTAFAGTITVKNATGGETYNAYKVFDAHTSGGNTYYTYDGSNATFLSAIQNTNSPFIVSLNSSNIYNVSLKSGVADADVAAFLKANIANLGSVAATATPSADGTALLSVADNGYYYVDSTLGAVVTLDSNTTNIEVLDKNQKPGPGTDDPTDPTSDAHYKQIVDASGNYVAQETSYDYGTTVYFKLSCAATNYDGETQITEYVAHDVLGAGYKNFAIDSVVVSDHNGSHNLTASNYTYDSTNKTVTIPWTNNGTSIYASNATIDIFCHALMNDSSDNYTNQGYFTWTGRNDADVPAAEKETVTVETRNIVIDDVHDATDDTVKLEGSYVLQDEDDKYYSYDPTTGVVSWVDDIDDATVITTNANGEATIEGIADGEYKLVETATPDGYNPLETPKVVSVNGSDATTDIAYSRGTALPATGALGTAMLIGIGSLVVIGAGLFLVTNMRMKKEDILG